MPLNLIRAGPFILLVLAAGASAGMVHATANFILVEPHIDTAVEIESVNLEEPVDLEFRDLQKAGGILGATILGVSTAALFGIVYILSRGALPGDREWKKMFILAGIMWLVIFMVPFLKYPGDPPAVGDPETIQERTALYAGFIVISGSAAVVFYKMSKQWHGFQKIGAALGYCVVMIAVAYVMPAAPDVESFPTDVLFAFRASSVVAVATYWIALPLLMGIFWTRLKPDISSYRQTRT